ncbi:PLP-dependent aminotransferase family protein [Azospirillum sp. SYSU D00513]|uniref:aminotransferase-like domain-containing protein n=1 Tax=Azospirillum sp. SYSU D00513 TaxID=2812561 RepID=UPI001A966283|nr:PLP-dependent aminotransferase family protein [Azospirillum sp. SYSU D00513]
MSRAPNGWMPALPKSGPKNGKPHYLAIADAIAEDIRAGRLAAGDRLPPQRALAERLSLNFTTVARGYNEAQRRGLIASRVGFGTFVPEGAPAAAGTPPRAARKGLVDMTMNLPPELEDQALLARMRQGLADLGEDLPALLRYQEFGGSEEDRQAGVEWLARRGLTAPRERLLVTPGSHSALLAVLDTVAKAGDVVLAEALTYPGIRALAAQRGLHLLGMPMDEFGLTLEGFEEACRTRRPKALYLNPTLQNPTTATIPVERRRAIAEIARRHDVAIIEDDAYGLLPESGPDAFASLAPEMTFHICGLAKSLGAGLRIAYLVVPDARRIWPVTASLRAATVMASPLTAALATRWIGDGTGDAVLAAIREESRVRRRLAAEILPLGSFRTGPEAFHLWMELPSDWSRSGFVTTMRSSGIGVVASDAFAITNPPPEAVRVCLGGLLNRDETRFALEQIAHALEQSPAMAAALI